MLLHGHGLTRTAAAPPEPVPPPEPRAAPELQVSAGYGASFALLENGELWGWGRYFQAFMDLRVNPSPVLFMEDVVYVAAGGRQLTAITSDSALWSWGFTEHGIILQPSIIMENNAAVSAGDEHTMALTNCGELWGWGSNEAGQIGIGRSDRQYINIDLPIKIMDDVTAVSAGRFFTMAITSDGTLWSWGDKYRLRGTFGEASSEYLRPRKVMENIAAVSAGANHVLALKNDRTLWAWGVNAFGQVGDGSGGDRAAWATWAWQEEPTGHAVLEPIQIMENVVYIAAGDSHSMAITADCTLWSWGSNTGGQVGDGTATVVRRSQADRINDRLVPVAIMGSVVSASSGGSHAMAVTAEGEVMAWGSNSMGQVGDGLELIDRHTPVNIALPPQAPTGGTFEGAMAAYHSLLSLLYERVGNIPHTEFDYGWRDGGRGIQHVRLMEFDDSGIPHLVVVFIERLGGAEHIITLNQ